ncbi:hypothetical protein J5N97_022327 [Dioscorea zingiberensis]|uniref:Uncharacterized protein n=1 Tax=Dioscorea zingiberensis TaxID=325984 RepID=A0A9D5HAS1_9LILI|nr:hypothetical protein J5N97_022327 [Dioscorea zingiberensis]
MALRSKSKNTIIQLHPLAQDSSGEESHNLIEKPVQPPSCRPSTLSQALASTAHLANLLPTGTVLAFQLLIPIFTNNGSCDAVTRPLTLCLLAVLAASCFLACFTDSFRSPDGKLHYGIATLHGLWLFEVDTNEEYHSGVEMEKYRLRLMDCMHAFMSVMVFASIALRDKNVVSCFYPLPEHETQEVLDIVPLGVGVLCSCLFVLFPTRRHGVGFPVTNGVDRRLKSKNTIIQLHPLAQDSSGEESHNLIEKPVQPPSRSPSTLSKALASTAHLANLLPTGTVLTFRLLIPIFTNNGSCDAGTRPLTLCLLAVLAASCFLACFTDSFRSPDGKLHYGIATLHGLWLFEVDTNEEYHSGVEMEKYRLRLMDCMHAFMSLMVFASIALRDKNVVSCLYSLPEHETQVVLEIVPLGVGVLCSCLFVLFPTRRHGVGFPVTNGDDRRP